MVGKETVVFPGLVLGAHRRPDLLAVHGHRARGVDAEAHSVAGDLHDLERGAVRAKNILPGAACHGEKMSGNAGFPSLVDIATRRSAAQVDSIIRNGSGRMPAFSSISAATRAELVKYLMGGKVKATQASPHPPQ